MGCGYQKNINEYNADLFQDIFKLTPIYSHLVNDYNKIAFKNVVSVWEEIPTPRQQLGYSVFSAVPFYYLDYLTKQNPTNIFDLGCGWNIFKKYIPNIIGVGAEDGADFFGDEHDFVDDEFVQHHQNTYESVFSINSLHFIPLSQIRKLVLDFISMIQVGGHGFLALNATKMIMRDKAFFSTSVADIDQYIRAQLHNVPAEYLVFDVNLDPINDWLDGNIKMVFRKSAPIAC